MPTMAPGDSKKSSQNHLKRPEMKRKLLIASLLICTLSVAAQQKSDRFIQLTLAGEYKGIYYANGLKYLKYYMKNPAALEKAPEQVNEDVF